MAFAKSAIKNPFGSGLALVSGVQGCELTTMHHTMGFASQFITNLEVCPTYRVEGLVIRKGDLLRARIKPYDTETVDGPGEV